MSNHLTLGRLTRALAVAVALGSCLVAYGDNVVVDETNGYGPNDRPVFAFISATPVFDLPILGEVDRRLRNQASSLGSPVLCLNIGTFVAGDSIETTRFVTAGSATFDTDEVPTENAPGGKVPVEFVGNPLTMVGSFKTLAPDSAIHLMTAYPDPISPQVQEAYFNASVFLETGGLSAFPTTVELALFIFDNQGGAGASINSILQEIFFVNLAAPVILQPPPPAPAPPILTGEGDFFPHTPGDALFGFNLELDLETGILGADVCFGVAIDVKPGNSANVVNVKDDNGVLSIAILTTDSFDAFFELDPDTVVAVLMGTDGEVVSEVGQIQLVRHDVDADGDKDLVFKFSMTALVDGPNAPLTTTSTTITLRGETVGGMCVQGSDTITVVPN
jgi:hypothetical protein